MAYGKSKSNNSDKFPKKDPGCDPAQREWAGNDADGSTGGGGGKGSGLNSGFEGAPKSGKP